MKDMMWIEIINILAGNDINLGIPIAIQLSQSSELLNLKSRQGEMLLDGLNAYKIQIIDGINTHRN